MSRCLKTAGVTQEQAHAFQAKFWKMHVDSSKAAAAALPRPAPDAAAKATAGTARSRLELLDCSADPEPGADAIPFKQRIRPGMVISWDPAGEYAMFSVGTGKSLASVLAPAGAVGDRVRDVLGGAVKSESGDEKYLCALMTPAVLPGAYDLNLWRQVVVSAEQMESEVLMEWDTATRYYYRTV